MRSLQESKGTSGIILVVDEIQKIANWSEAVKKEWDDDSFHDRDIKVLLLGSSRVLLEKGLSESLGGRFEEIRMTHWSYPEMRDCFGFTFDQYVFYGGYPGAAALIDDDDRYQQYVQSAIVEATINKDILMDTPVGKPALLRQTFELGAAYSGQLLSLNKMLGSLQDAGNTTTLAGYVNLLNESGMQKRHRRPAVGNPCAVARRHIVSRKKLIRYIYILQHLLHNSRFTHLSRTHHHLNKPSWLFQSLCNCLIFTPLVHVFTFYSMQ